MNLIGISRPIIRLFSTQSRSPGFEDLIKDRYFLERYDSVMRAFDAYMQEKDTWFNVNYPPQLADEHIAYFSFEYGLHESLKVYAGGLGILSGDHVKEASDLDLPFTAVGFLYTYGYFAQRITEDGWQVARNVEINFNDLPIASLYDKNGEPVKISVDCQDVHFGHGFMSSKLVGLPLCFCIPTCLKTARKTAS